MKCWIVVLTVLFAAVMLSGCSWFQSKENSEKPSTTQSTMSDTTPAPETSTHDTYVEPRRPWGSETLDNLQKP